jgi:hypothetical protein
LSGSGQLKRKGKSVSHTEPNPKRVYLSCVTKELRTLRGKIEDIFSTLGGDVETTNIWGLEGEDIGSEIRAKIERCRIFVQLLGSSYGPVHPDEPGESSYLRYEHSCAELAGKQIHLILVGPGCDRDQTAEAIDDPLDNSEAESLLEKRRGLQEDYLRELAASGYELHYAESHDEAQDAIFQIWSRPDEMRQRYLERKAREEKRKRSRRLVALALAALVIVAAWFAVSVSRKPALEARVPTAQPETVNSVVLAEIENTLIARAVHGLKNSVGKGAFVFGSATYKEKIAVIIYRDRFESTRQFIAGVTRKSLEGTLSENTKKVLILMQDNPYGTAQTAFISKGKESFLEEIRAEGGREDRTDSTARSFLLDMIALARSEGDLEEARELADLAVEADPNWRAALLAKGSIALSQAHAVRRGENRQKELVHLQTSTRIAANLLESRLRDQEALKLQIMADLDLAKVNLGTSGRRFTQENLFQDFENVLDRSLNYREEFSDDPDGGLLVVECLHRMAMGLIYGRPEDVLKMNRDRHFRVIKEFGNLAEDVRNDRRVLRMETELYFSLSQLSYWISFQKQKVKEEGIGYLKKAVQASVAWDTNDPADFEGVWCLITNQIALGDALMRKRAHQAEKWYRAALYAARIYREQNPDDPVALNFYCRALTKLGECLSESGSSGEFGPAFPLLNEAHELSSAAFKAEPRNGFAALGYLNSLRSLAKYLSDSSDLSDKIKAQTLDKTGFQVALDFYRAQPDETYAELQVKLAFLRLEQVDPVLRDSEILGEAEDKLMKTLRDSMENGVALSGGMADLYERLRMKKKETK